MCVCVCVYIYIYICTHVVLPVILRIPLSTYLVVDIPKNSSANLGKDVFSRVLKGWGVKGGVCNPRFPNTPYYSLSFPKVA